MTSEMVERVAGALHAAHAEVGWPADECETCDKLARAAIEAMREPTEAMIRAGEPVVYDCYSLEPGEGLDENPALPTWQAMIDAALQDEVVGS